MRGARVTARWRTRLIKLTALVVFSYVGLVFANVAYFEEQLQHLLATSPNLEVLIIDAVSINEIDASGELMLRDYYRRLTESGIHVLFTRVRMPIQKMFAKSGTYKDIGRSISTPTTRTEIRCQVCNSCIASNRQRRAAKACSSTG